MRGFWEREAVYLYCMGGETSVLEAETRAAEEVVDHRKGSRQTCELEWNEDR